LGKGEGPEAVVALEKALATHSLPFPFLGAPILLPQRAMQSLTLLRNAGFLDETPQKLAQFITKVRGVGF
jgi:hypothetical protein